MKFCKRYQEYMRRYQDRLPGLSYLHLKKFKKILKRCSFKYHKQAGRSFALDEESSSGELSNSNAERDDAVIACHTSCPVCDGTFFPSLLAEMDAVVCCFNERVKQLLELHLASGFRKYLMWITSKMGDNRFAMIQEGRDLVSYASINALAIRKIVKKYDKVHHSKQGREFRTRAQTMHMEILQSPWLNELIALHINLINSNNTTAFVTGDCSLIFDDGKPSLSCTLLDSLRLDIDLTCSICLDTLFEPVSLKCGHIFCHSCACSAASVTIIEGLKEADHTSKCPICRQSGVYKDAVHLVELSMLLSKSCEKYWEQRLQRERVERLQQAKEHWENQCRAFMGL